MLLVGLWVKSLNHSEESWLIAVNIPISLKSLFVGTLHAFLLGIVRTVLNFNSKVGAGQDSRRRRSLQEKIIVVKILQALDVALKVPRLLDCVLPTSAKVNNFLDGLFSQARIIAPNCDKTTNFRIKDLFCHEAQLVYAGVFEGQLPIVMQVIDWDAV